MIFRNIPYRKDERLVPTIALPLFSFTAPSAGMGSIVNGMSLAAVKTNFPIKFASNVDATTVYTPSKFKKVNQCHPHPACQTLTFDCFHITVTKPVPIRTRFRYNVTHRYTEHKKVGVISNADMPFPRRPITSLPASRLPPKANV
jgi:hypothetical protein